MCTTTLCIHFCYSPIWGYKSAIVCPNFSVLITTEIVLQRNSCVAVLSVILRITSNPPLTCGQRKTMQKWTFQPSEFKKLFQHKINSWAVILHTRGYCMLFNADLLHRHVVVILVNILSIGLKKQIRLSTCNTDMLLPIYITTY